MKVTWKEQLEQHRNKRREDIIQTAKELFLEHGLSTVTLKDIVGACGISKVTLYKYFNSLDEIIFEVQFEILSAWLERYNQTALQGNSGYEKLQFLLEQILVSKDNTDTIRFIAMFDMRYLEEYPTPELESRFRSFLRRGPHPFLSLLQEGVADGSIRRDIDVKAIGYTISNVVNATKQRMLLRGKLLHLDQDVDPAIVLEHTVNMILAYVKS
ncbi:TetR/AcrR family transcriptional regulator [Paenibacillus filicis]|uniref:TetR/AcrR family transcriptional regulator n=1 Tax=Paenibacillus gyeongsangnamensis TaxID=3388067 RepID=A0ABT4Q8H8_9BACL|nr:TetR/AcrR family transcriptional regulator [Paenibacillus filicis]MCZ8513184.1 TetR/AcrR family transcriptional regulator [Paenibacillus filicis]